MDVYIVDVVHAVTAERLRQAQVASAGRLRAERRAPHRRRVRW